MQPQYQQPYAPQPYPAQQPPMPQYPAQPAYAPQPYPQQYAPPAPAGPPPPPGSLDTFYSQPSTGGGPSFKFMDANRAPQIGKSYAGFVARPIADSDVEAQTDQAGNVRTYKDGRPKFVLKVPMQVQPSQEFPEGLAQWYVKGQARDELARAMAEAGAPAGPPEHGAFIQVTLTGTRPVPNMNPQYLYRVVYQRPQGAAPVAPQAPVADPAAHQTPPYTVPALNTMPAQPVQAPVALVLNPQGSVHGPDDRNYAPANPNMDPRYTTTPVAPQPVPVQQPATPAPQQGTTAAPAGFTEEQAALFARLTGGQPS